MKYCFILIIVIVAFGCVEKVICESPCPADYTLIEGTWLSLDSVLVQDTNGWKYINDTLFISKYPIPGLGYNYDYVFAMHGSKPAFYKMTYYDENQLDLVYMGPTMVNVTETFNHNVYLSENNKRMRIDDLKSTYPASLFNKFKRIE